MVSGSKIPEKGGRKGKQGQNGIVLDPKKQKKKKLGLLSPNPTATEEEKEKKKKKKKKKKEGIPEASQATALRLAHLRSAFMKGSHLPSGEAQRVASRRPAPSLGVPFTTIKNP